MVKENERFLKRIDKFMQRHYIKPGITGLAQVKGFRGEVKTDEDIVNRLKYDLYYIENWSFWLDIKIVLFTILNVIKGEEKAY
jgi:putative colanic acid biosynthesis UDP-glucose lipid carrier transferase